MTFEVVYHFDVWRDAREGFEVNESRSAGVVELPEYPEANEIMQALKHVGLLAKHCRLNMLNFVDKGIGSGHSFEIGHHKTGKPMFSIRALPAEYSERMARWTVTKDYAHDCISVDAEGKEGFFIQGDDCAEFWDMDEEEIIDYLDRLGVL